MSNAETGAENTYLEMVSIETTAYEGLYDDVVGESKTTSATKQMTSEKQKGSSSQSEAMVQRLLHIMAALVFVSFLIATATLILVLLPMKRLATLQPPQQIVLPGCTLKKVQDLTERLESTQDELRSVKSQLFLIDGQMGNNSKTDLEKELQNVWMAINSTAEKTSTLTGKLNNISKIGFNGSQGPAGPAGSVGPPVPNGSGNFSSCQYKVVTDTPTPGGFAEATADLAEPNGKRVLGVSCSTNFAAEYNLLSIMHNNVRRYTCSCKGTSTLFTPFGGKQKSCYLHYWECPLTT